MTWRPRRSEKSTKILIVEDFKAFRELICKALVPRPHFQLIQASDGLEAVRKAEEVQPDLILLDIGLPKLNGIDVARRVRKLAAGAKILFVTQECSLDVVREALGLGALGYVHKTRVKSELLLAIDTVLGGEQFVSSYVLSALTSGRNPTTHLRTTLFRC